MNLAHSYFRRRAAERRAKERLAQQPHTDESVPRQVDAIAVRRAVAQLPHRQKTALLLRYFADLPISEVADMMGCPEGTVKTLIHRAVKSLRASRDLQLPQEVSDVF